MPKTSDIELGKRIKLGLLGPNGFGKTHAYGDFPGPMYIFDFDNHHRVIVFQETKIQNKYNLKITVKIIIIPV